MGGGSVVSDRDSDHISFDDGIVAGDVVVAAYAVSKVDGEVDVLACGEFFMVVTVFEEVGVNPREIGPKGAEEVGK